MMHNKRLKISLSVLAIVALLAIFVLAGESHFITANAIYSVNTSTNLMSEFDLLRHVGIGAVRDFNLSGTLLNLSFAITKGGPSPANERVSNISIMWQLRSNNSIMRNDTHSNRTGDESCPSGNDGTCVNMTNFNFSVDTTTMPDGTYNLTVMIYNLTTGGSGSPFINVTNVSMIINITIDNTPPAVANLRSLATTFTHISAFNQILGANVTDVFTGVKNVTFSFNNATVLPFNITANNNSGEWNTTYNLSTLRAGAHTITVFAFDFAQSLNKTQTITFTLNTPMNVTPIALTNRSSNAINTATTGQYFTVKNGQGSPTSNVTFNISVQNSTQATILDRVIFQFNNASGVVFNITANETFQGVGNGNNNLKYFWVRYNVSNLKAGAHTVTVFSNDSLSNVNRTEVFTFTVNTAPNVTSVVDNLFNNTLSIEGKNFTGEVFNKTFNISVQNASGPETLTTIGEDANGRIPIDQVILMFNTNGTPFNRTAGLTHTLGAGVSYFSVGVNLTGMSEGHHTVTVFTNDTWGNLNKTEVIAFTVDKTVPTVSVSCSSDSVTLGATVTCECTASDATSGLTGYHFGDGQRSEAPSTSTVGSHTSSTCTATDYAGHVSTAYATYTVAASSGGSGSLGSSGGSSSGAAGQFEKKVWASINAGETAAVSIKNGAIGVTEVSFSVPSAVWGGWVQVAKKATLPSSAAAAFTGKVYRNLEITKGPALKDDVIRDAKVEFKVEKAWLLENKLPKESVALHRYADGVWTQLTTRVAQEDEAYVHYAADTPGFSYFVIGEKVGLAAPVAEALTEAPSAEAPSAEVPAEEATVAAELKKLDTAGWVVALVAAVVIIAAVLIYLKRRR